MSATIYTDLFNSGKKIFALLIDPEKHSENTLVETIKKASECGVDLILTGGSLTSRSFDNDILLIKSLTKIPVVLFPGNLMQLSANADGVLLLSLISGRNPDFLIGNHVLASQFLKRSKLEIIPTGYILVNGDHSTAVEYISNSQPIPRNKTDLVVATALAGEQLGLKLIYLEAGSGAERHIGIHTVEKVKKSIDIPLIVGGGIRDPKEIRELYEAGADGVVIGSAIEDDPGSLPLLAAARDNYI